jgi:hypothetical protein
MEKKRAKDEKDLQIDRLRGINEKLRQKLKDLNGVLERTLEKANNRKIYKINANKGKEQDVQHQIHVR